MSSIFRALGSCLGLEGLPDMTLFWPGKAGRIGNIVVTRSRRRTGKFGAAPRSRTSPGAARQGARRLSPSPGDRAIRCRLCTFPN
jgi:hypothetical protein